MKLSQIINYPLGLLGLQMVRISKLKLLHEQASVSDIEKDAAFLKLYDRVKPFTMVNMVRCYALYKAMQYIIRYSIKGDLVECGVWKGGSCLLMAIMLKEAGIMDKHIYLYDTYEGMTRPGAEDGEFEKKEWERQQVNEQTNNWCRSSLEEVQENIKQAGYPFANFHFIKGKVEETIPSTIPSQIALLRLDTDWYESTLHELKHLYPLLVEKGILLIDDYGSWQGSHKATDEYFTDKGPVFFNRIDWAGMLIVK